MPTPIPIMIPIYHSGGSLGFNDHPIISWIIIVLHILTLVILLLALIELEYGDKIRDKILEYRYKKMQQKIEKENSEKMKSYSDFLNKKETK